MTDDRLQDVLDSLPNILGAQPHARVVIAPLLSPNLGLGTALGDLHLMKKFPLTTFAGIGLAILLSIAMGMLLPFNHASLELMARMVVGLDSVALALASGAAAALSLTTGLSSVLVGVMVAVALLSPAVAPGLMLGVRETDLAMGAGLLLAVNLACVNLAVRWFFSSKAFGLVGSRKGGGTACHDDLHFRLVDHPPAPCGSHLRATGPVSLTQPSSRFALDRVGGSFRQPGVIHGFGLLSLRRRGAYWGYRCRPSSWESFCGSDREGDGRPGPKEKAE